ncbi:hypothetical protein Tco_0386280 [Tanacetum coccineum]
MSSNIKNFKCLIHFNETQRGFILSEDLTYSMLHEMVMRKFKLEANAVINLSFKLSSFDFAVDITDDDEIHTFLNYLRPVLMIDAAHLKGLYKGTNLVGVAMDGNNQIVPIAFGIVAKALAVEKEFPFILCMLQRPFRAMGARMILKRRQLAGLVPFEDAIQERDTILMYTHHNRLHVYVSRVELSPLVVAELFRDETNKRENQGKPSCAKKLFV